MIHGEGSPYLYKIMVYPIKSLPPVELPEARITRYGTLEWDRLYALVDERGLYVNGKRERRIHLVRARYDLLRGLVYLSACCGEEQEYSLDKEPEEVSRWFTRFLGYSVRLVKRPEGYPDDEANRGPTVISTGTLAEVGSWFGWDLLQARLRFRANLEIGGVEPFWEDQLYAGKGKAVVFRVGEVLMEGRNISKRCVVPSRDPFTAAVTIGFQKEFVRRRKPMLRGKYPESDHGYRLSINTVVRPGQEGKVLKIGDPVEVLGLKR